MIESFKLRDSMPDIPRLKFLMPRLQDSFKFAKAQFYILDFTEISKPAWRLHSFLVALAVFSQGSFSHLKKASVVPCKGKRGKFGCCLDNAERYELYL